MQRKVVLSNNDIHEDYGTIEFWPDLVDKCRSNNLKIKAFYLNNEHIDKNADGFFCHFEATVFDIFNPDTTTVFRVGVGSINLSLNKARYRWFDSGTGEYIITEVRSNYDRELVQDLFIPQEKCVQNIKTTKD